MDRVITLSIQQYVGIVMFSAFVVLAIVLGGQWLWDRLSTKSTNPLLSEPDPLRPLEKPIHLRDFYKDIRGLATRGGFTPVEADWIATMGVHIMDQSTGYGCGTAYIAARKAYYDTYPEERKAFDQPTVITVVDGTSENEISAKEEVSPLVDTFVVSSGVCSEVGPAYSIPEVTPAEGTDAPFIAVPTNLPAIVGAPEQLFSGMSPQ